MKEWLKTKLIYILGILLALSIAGNVFLALKGLVINQYITSTSRSDSYANSSSMSIGYIGGSAQGEMKVKNFDCQGKAATLKFLNTLDPIQFLLVRIVHNPSIGINTIYYPEITPYKSTMKAGKEDYKEYRVTKE